MPRTTHRPGSKQASKRRRECRGVIRKVSRRKRNKIKTLSGHVYRA